MVPASKTLVLRACAAFEALFHELEAGPAPRGLSVSAIEPDQLKLELATAVLRAAACLWAERRGIDCRLLKAEGRLFARTRLRAVSERAAERVQRALEPDNDWSELPVEALGAIYEGLIACTLTRESENRRFALSTGRVRKNTGSFFTPRELTSQVVDRSFEPLAASLDLDPSEQRLLDFRVCDPALGAGAFLLEAGRKLATLLEMVWQRTGQAANAAQARRQVLRSLYGVDSSGLAVALAEACLWLWAADPGLPLHELRMRLREGDSLSGPDPGRPLPGELSDRASGFDWSAEFSDVFATAGGFDLVLGNPPWVAFAGRAARPLAREMRDFYRRSYSAWRGYPTLHGLFIERATRIAPSGVIALVVPSPISDLDGYRATRLSATRCHVVREPLLEFGQDAFDAVTQPCFALIADPRAGAQASDRSWRLTERQRAAGEAEELRIPELVEALLAGPRLPPELFGEMGFQSSRLVTSELFLRASEPDTEHRYPLLEGRDVSEFKQGAPRLFLREDPEILRRARCRLRPMIEYRRARFVVRQTASVPIAALHGGLPFRNTLLAGFVCDEYSAELMVGLLNSALYRAMHLAARRDARQAAFPQVKISHLRSLPTPPPDAGGRQYIAELAERASRLGIDASLRQKLDAAVFDLFGATAEQKSAVLGFLTARAPRLGHVGR